ncbi:hypothetical protein B0O99DRAFT_602111 [Bisporella sp. PMI_857]|nr:hypothetical protein B0O99DRAFT_602111 [Bisporella sp. PMI_857]
MTEIPQFCLGQKTVVFKSDARKMMPVSNRKRQPARDWPAHVDDKEKKEQKAVDDEKKLSKKKSSNEKELQRFDREPGITQENVDQSNTSIYTTGLLISDVLGVLEYRKEHGNDGERSSGPRRPKAILPTTYSNGIMKMAHQRAYDNSGHDDGRHRPLQGIRRTHCGARTIGNIKG